MQPNKTLESIPVAEVYASETFNSRGKIRAIDVSELAADIEKRGGLIQPVVVRPLNAAERENPDFAAYNYFLVSGFRRTMAHVVLKWAKIDAIIRNDLLSAEDCYLFNLSENLQRKNLSVLQEAKALEKLKNLGVTETDAAGQLNKSRGWVQIRYMLLTLPEDIQAEVDAGLISQTNVRELYTISRKHTVNELYEAARRVKEGKASGRKGGRATITAGKLESEPNAKRLRKRGEIFEMMDHIQTRIGNNLGTRSMAWCAGEISNMEMYLSLKEFADENGQNYSMPLTSGD